MKQAIKTSLAIVAGLASIVSSVAMVPAANAYGPERTEYTKDKINTMMNNYLQNKEGDKWEPSKIVFNSISDGKIGHEFNFVGARECTVQSDGRCNPANQSTVWNADDIEVEDGKTYIVRLYVHNNNPYGCSESGVDKCENDTERANSEAGTAKNVKTSFSVPSTSGNKVTVNGSITTDSGEIGRYVDYVNFYSKTANFHLDYVYGSALLENNAIGEGGLKLSDDVVQAKSGGTLIGYDKLDGRIPGCYQYSGFVTIQVKAIFDYDFTVEKQVRMHDSEDRSWHKAVEAKVGDKVDFQIQYRNTSEWTQSNVSLRDMLPKNLKYVEGSTKIMNSNHPNGASIVNDDIVKDGIKIGSYGKGANAYVMFTAEVVDNDLVCGATAAVNYVRAGVGYTAREDHATVRIVNDCEPEEPKGDTPTKLPSTGPEATIGGIIAAGSIATAAGYYVASRRQLRK